MSNQTAAPSKRPSLKDRNPLKAMNAMYRPSLRDDEATASVAPASTPTVAPRPEDDTRSVRQTSFMLADRHVEWLEERCLEARRNRGRPLSKSTLVRTLIEVAMDTPMDLTSLKSNRDLIRRIEDAIARK